MQSQETADLKKKLESTEENLKLVSQQKSSIEHNYEQLYSDLQKIMADFSKIQSKNKELELQTT